MDYREAVTQLTPELVQTFRRVLELGRWPNGSELTANQREHCMQAVIAYEATQLPAADRVGYIASGCKTKQPPDRPSATAGQTAALRWHRQTERDKA